jgi:very-short-patch-repair endonuclease
MGPKLLRIPQIPLIAQYGGTVIEEATFVRLYLEERLSGQAFLDLGVSYKILSNSVRAYKEKYATQIRERKYLNYSAALKGNTHGIKAQPGVVIPRERLQECVDRGYTYSMTAKVLNVSAWFVRQNMRAYGMTPEKKLTYKILATDMEQLRDLEQYAPGLMKTVTQFYQDPHAYYKKLYEAFSHVIELTWFIKEQARNYNQYKGRGQVPADHICWSLNRHEMLLSMALTDSKIPHTRQVAFYKNYLADFGFPGHKLLVEIDGSFHAQADTTKRDISKQKEAVRLGYKTLRFTTKEVEEKLPHVVTQICLALAE